MKILNMIKLSLFLIIVFSFYSQATAESQKWKASDIVGYKLKLIDKNTVESLTFSANPNLVRATVGSVDGWLAAPLWYWEIDNDGILIIKDADGKTRHKMKKLYEKTGRIGVEFLEVELSGIKVEYEKKKR